MHFLGVTKSISIAVRGKETSHGLPDKHANATARHMQSALLAGQSMGSSAVVIRLTKEEVHNSHDCCRINHASLTFASFDKIGTPQHELSSIFQLYTQLLQLVMLNGAQGNPIP